MAVIHRRFQRSAPAMLGAPTPQLLPVRPQVAQSNASSGKPAGLITNVREALEASNTTVPSTVPETREPWRNVGEALNPTEAQPGLRPRSVLVMQRPGQPWGPYRSFSLPLTFTEDAEVIERLDRVQRGEATGLTGAIERAVFEAEQSLRRSLGLPLRQIGDPVATGLDPNWQRPLNSVALPSALFRQQWVVMRGLNGRLDAAVPLADALLPGGRWLFAEPCPADRASTQPSFAVERVTIPLSTPQGRIAGPVIEHFADLSLAQWWFRIAYALVTDNSIINELDRTDPRTGRVPGQADGDNSPYGWEAQISYVRSICEAIANGYNALNIPWYIDPVARELWRDWFAGHDTRGEFEVESDTNEGYWFTKAEQCGERRFVELRPRFRAGEALEDTSRVGQYAAMTAALWLSEFDDENKTLEFLQRAGVILVSPGNERDPYLAPRAANKGFASGFNLWGRALLNSKNKFVTDLTDNWENLTPENKRQIRDSNEVVGVYRPEFFGQDWYAQALHSDPLRMRDQIVDWRTGSIDPPGVGAAHVQVAIPLRWYLAWLREWAKSLCEDPPVFGALPTLLPQMNSARRSRLFANGIPQRNVRRIVADSISYAFEINLVWSSKFGGNRRYIEALAQKSEVLATRRPAQGFAIAGNVINMLGQPVLNAVMPGIGSLVGAGVNFLASMLGHAFATTDCSQFGRDDLGRHKPVLERTYLDGNPETGDPPRLTIPMPPAFCRGTVAPWTDPGLRPLELPGGDRPPPPPPPEGLSTGAKLAIAAAAIAVGGGAVYYYVNRPKTVA